MARNLYVYLRNNFAGTLTQGESGRLRFSYSADYKGPRLSVSMPISTTTIEDEIVRPWLMGLVPEDETVLAELSKDRGVTVRNPFSVLSEIGEDCQGAVQFFKNPAQSIPSETVVPLTESEVADRLRRSLASRPSFWAPSERWSLGGNQSKLAFRRIAGGWASCKGSAATTHILKPGVEGLSLQALDEHMCMRIAEAAGLSVAHSEYMEFEDIPTIVVERYDRVVTAEQVTRVHQEDFCQALGVDPSHKYASDGGPSANDCIDLLRKSTVEDDVTRFVQALFYNYLICGTDAHAKNYSLLHATATDVTLAPLYDVASFLPYWENRRRTPKLAMSIGGENRFGRVGVSAIRRFAEQNGLSSDTCILLMKDLASRVAEAAAIVSESVRAGIPESASLCDTLEAGITESCETTVYRLS